jgi:hypothetical protein
MQIFRILWATFLDLFPEEFVALAMVFIGTLGGCIFLFSAPPLANMRLVLIGSICAACVIILFLGWRSVARWNEWDKWNGR